MEGLNKSSCHVHCRTPPLPDPLARLNSRPIILLCFLLVAYSPPFNPMYVVLLCILPFLSFSPLNTRPIVLFFFVFNVSQFWLSWR